MSMPMTRVLFAACCALLPILAWAQSAPSTRPRAKPPADCPQLPAQCQVSAQVFDFGRHTMSSTSPPIHSNGTISVTCTRVAQNGLSVDVEFELKGLPPDPARQMRDQIGAYLAYDMYVDPARTRYWGDGTQGTATFQSTCLLDDRNRVCTIPFVLYGKVHGQQGATPPGQWLGAVVSRLEYRFANCRT